MVLIKNKEERKKEKRKIDDDNIGIGDEIRDKGLINKGLGKGKKEGIVGEDKIDNEENK